MTQTKKKRQLVTPFGRSGYCSLIRPSFKFAPEEGKFSARLILGPEEGAEFIAKLDELYEAAYQENLDTQNAERAAKKKAPLTEIKRADKPYKHVEDPDTGEKLPDFQINFGLKFRRMGKDETGNKVVFGTQRPIVVDSKGQPVRQEIGMGSSIRVSFIPGGFFTAALGSGLSLKLIGVQVKELVQLGLENPEFDDVEGGYEAPQTKASDPVEHTEAPQAGSVDADEDAEWS